MIRGRISVEGVGKIGWAAYEIPDECPIDRIWELYLLPAFLASKHNATPRDSVTWSVVNAIIDARFVWDREHPDDRVREVHVSPAIERTIAITEREMFVLPRTGVPTERPIMAVGVNWFVDPALTGEDYRFVTSEKAST